MLKAIVFDFDGTLTPLTLDFTLLKTEVLKIAEKYASKAAIRELESHYIIEMIYAIAGMLRKKATADEFQREVFEALRILELQAAQNKDLYPYARDTLESLKAKGIKIGIITRTCTDVLKSVFEDMEQYVRTVVTRDHTKHVKPHPLHVLKALRMLRVDPAEALLVGDHPTDVMGGKAAGMMTAGVLTGRTGKKAFEEVGADHILNDIRGLLRLKTVSARPVLNTRKRAVSKNRA